MESSEREWWRYSGSSIHDGLPPWRSYIELWPCLKCVVHGAIVLGRQDILGSMLWLSVWLSLPTLAFIHPYLQILVNCSRIVIFSNNVIQTQASLANIRRLEFGFKCALHQPHPFLIQCFWNWQLTGLLESELVRLFKGYWRISRSWMPLFLCLAEPAEEFSFLFFCSHI